MDGKALNGKTALLTGATSGIGEAIAWGMSAAGAKVAICGRRQKEGEKIAKSLSGNGRAGDASSHSTFRGTANL